MTNITIPAGNFPLTKFRFDPSTATNSAFLSSPDFPVANIPLNIEGSAVEPAFFRFSGKSRHHDTCHRCGGPRSFPLIGRKGAFRFPGFASLRVGFLARSVSPKGAKRQRRGLPGFTLTETLVAISITAILAALTIQGYSKIAASVAKGKCISNLRNLHVAFATYVQDNGYWPQQPDFDGAYSQEYQDWWLKTMDPYTQSREVWKCPLLKKYGVRVHDADGKNLEIHYAPTRFDEKPTTPYRWEKQPWLIEVSSVHGGGPLLLMPDGSVRNLTDFVPNYRTKN